ITSYASSISGYPSLSINDVFNIIKQIISDWQGRTFNLVANFKAVQAQLPSLNISASPSNAGTVYPTSISNITPSTSATITATPNSGYQFTGWTLNGTPLSITSLSLSLSQIFSLLQTGINNLVANFKQVITTATLIVSAGPGGSVSNAGTYTLPPSGGVMSTQKINIDVIKSPSRISKYYNAIFVETGLPSGTEWSVTFNGNTKSSSSNTITFTVPGGTYQYIIEPVSGYIANPSSGSLTLGGYNLNFTQNITFTTATQITSQYTINIVAGTGGTVSPSGTQRITSTTSPITVTATPNSGYQFTNWTIDSSNAGSNNPISLSYSILQRMGLTPGNYTLTANFTSSAISSVVFTPQANSGYQFSNWTLNGTDITSYASSYSGYPSLSINDVFNIIKQIISDWQGRTFNLVAQFKAVQAQLPSLNISASPSEGGTVYPISISNITPSTSATITATPNSGYQFTGWTLNGTPLSITSSSLSLSQIFSLLKIGVNNLVANFKQIVKTFLQIPVPTGGSVTDGGQTIDITDYLLNPSNALLNIIATPNTGYYFTGFTLNGHDITSYTEVTQSIGCAKQTIKSAVNNIKLSDLIQNFKNYINIGSTNILSVSFGLLPWKITMSCPCQSDGSAKCTFNVYDINGNLMSNVPIFIKLTKDWIVVQCLVGSSNDYFIIPGIGMGTAVVDVYAVQNLNAHANSGTIGIPCISLGAPSQPGTISKPAPSPSPSKISTL
ncbi:MAG: hypothetical protein QXL66_03375, partial [Thermoplasmata archaeon]